MQDRGIVDLSLRISLVAPLLLHGMGHHSLLLFILSRSRFLQLLLGITADDNVRDILSFLSSAIQDLLGGVD